VEPRLLLASSIFQAALAVEVPVHVAPSVPPPLVDRALEETARLFAQGEIDLRCRLFFAGPIDRDPEAAVTVLVRPKPERAVVSGCRRNLHDHRLGQTHLELRRITLWTEQVARAVHGDWDRGEAEVFDVDPDTLGVALGRVLAHELGHLFLTLNGHRDRGLMRSSFPHRVLIGKSDRPFRLSSEDMARVRLAIERFSAGENRDQPE
jgi:hypothetical protein